MLGKRRTYSRLKPPASPRGICDEAAKKEKSVKWAGSAEAMEPAMVVHINNDIHQKGHSVRKIVMDDDATTIAKSHSEIDIYFQKLSET